MISEKKPKKNTPVPATLDSATKFTTADLSQPRSASDSAGPASTARKAEVPKPNPDASQPAPGSATGQFTCMKQVELPAHLAVALAEKAVEETKRSSRRVTENEIIVAAVAKALGLPARLRR